MEVIKEIESVFKQFTDKDWEDLLVKESKGKTVEELSRTDRNGITINPFYTQSSAHSSSEMISENTQWYIQEYITVANDEKNKNKQILNTLKNGATGLNLMVNHNSVNWIDLFKDVVLDAIIVNVFCTDKVEIFGSLLSYYMARGYDNFGEHIRVFYASQAVTEYEINGQSIINIDASIYNNAGANAVTELAATLFQLHQSQNQFKEGLEYLIHIVISVDTNYFEQIAKIRALRHLISCWAGLYKVSVKLSIEAVTSSIYITQLSEENNLIRSTIAAMSAVMAGVNSVCVMPYTFDESRINTAHRLARNQLLLLQEESYFKEITDYGRNAYFIEYYTQQLAEKAWAEFVNLSSSSKWIADMSQSLIGEMIKKDAQELIGKYVSNQRTLVGVNKHKAANKTLVQYPCRISFGIESINIEQVLENHQNDI